MNIDLEWAMYALSQLFMIPVLLAVFIIFFYSFYALGAFIWQWRQRTTGKSEGFELHAALQLVPQSTLADLEALAVRRLELARLVSRVAPMLGLVATMIPMGPALKALADGQLQTVSQNLMVAFSAVILALIAASITYWVVNVRRRWYATELAAIEQSKAAGIQPDTHASPVKEHPQAEEHPPMLETLTQGAV